MDTTFQTEIVGRGNNTGIEVPLDNLACLGSGKRPAVLVTIGTYSYRSTIGTMDGKPMIPVSKAHREAAGVAAGDAVTVRLTLETGTRTVELPEVLLSALEAAGLKEVFAELTYSKRKEFCRQVDDAKTDETRARRIAKVLEALA